MNTCAICQRYTNTIEYMGHNYCHRCAPKEKIQKIIKTPNYLPRFPGDIEKTCAFCGKAFIRPAKQTNQKYCSQKCLLAAIRNKNGIGRFRIFERDKFRCIYCGFSSIKDGAELHADHIIPRHLGGADTAENLVTSCKYCNVEKGIRILPKDILADLQDMVYARNLESELNPTDIIKLPRR